MLYRKKIKDQLRLFIPCFAMSNHSATLLSHTPKATKHHEKHKQKRGLGELGARVLQNETDLEFGEQIWNLKV